MKKYAIILILLFSQCGKTERVFSLNEKDMRAQAMEMKQGRDDLTEYRVRVFPAREKVAEGGAALQEAMSYRADSLFYLEANSIRIYPDMVEPVPNGVQGSFEYRLLFTLPADSLRKTSLLYADRYITNRTYLLQAD